MLQQRSYAILTDPCARYEIRKHKWFLSEKAGHEIGFATAALDWIRNYGDAWRLYRFSELFNPASHQEPVYSFLNDPYAIHEIRRHKWLMSERSPYEIGFATAALDWITNYGDAWRLYRFSRLFNPDKHRLMSLI